MSHATKYPEKITDINTFLQTAESLGYEVNRGTGLSVKLFGSTTINCAASIKLTNWKYEVAVTPEGGLTYDAFGTPVEDAKRLKHLVRDYHKDLVIKNIPMDEVSHFVCNEVGAKKEIILTYN